MKLTLRNIYLQLFSALITLGLVLFISCANPESVDDEDFEDDDISLVDDESDEDDEDEEDEDFADSDDEDEEDGEDYAEEDDEDLDEEDDEEYAEEDGDEDFDDEDGEDYAEEDDEDLDEEDDEELAALDEDDDEGEYEDEGDEDEFEGDEIEVTENKGDVEELEEELTALEESSSGEDFASAEPVDDFSAVDSDLADGSAVAEENVSSDFLDEVPTVGDSSDSASFDSPEPVSAPIARKAYRSSVVPEIPSQAVNKSGATLNRFYFVRSGDTPREVASLLYGEPDRGSDLANWNGSRWKPGDVVYYQSPDSPDDGDIRSFYQARQVSPESYTIQRGEWLSNIAKNQYGDGRSWKEIAVVNGLATPDAIRSGQELALYPRDLSQYSAERVFPAQEPEPEPEPVVQNNQAPVQNEMAQNSAPQMREPEPSEPEQVQSEPLMEPEPTPMAKAPEPNLNSAPAPIKEPSAGISELIEKNMFTIAIVGVVLLLLITLSAIKKKKRKSRREDYGDDNFAARPKSRKKS